MKSVKMNEKGRTRTRHPSPAPAQIKMLIPVSGFAIGHVGDMKSGKTSSVKYLWGIENVSPGADLQNKTKVLSIHKIEGCNIDVIDFPAMTELGVPLFSFVAF